MAVLKAVDR